MKRSNFIPATNALPSDENVGHSSSAGALTKSGLEAGSEWVFIQFDDVGRGNNLVQVEEDVFCAFGMWTVSLGEDYDWQRISSKFDQPNCKTYSDSS